MPMKALCGAASLCPGAATVRQSQTPGEWWEAAGCVELTERVQLQQHAKLVAIQTEACPAVRSTQPVNALHALLYTIHTVSRWKRRCNCLDCHEFSSTPLRFRPHPRMPMQLSFHPHPRIQLQLHTLCALSTTRLVCGNVWQSLLRGTARHHRTGPSWASNDDPMKDLSNTRALKHLAPLATDYWAASHSFVEPGHSKVCNWLRIRSGHLNVVWTTFIRSLF
jgi:hypothetical protein